MYQRDTRNNLSPYGVSKKSPFNNYRQHIIRSQSLKGKTYNAVRSNGKMLEQFDATQKLDSNNRSFENFNEANQSLGMPLEDKNSRYKTEICRNFKERANCIYGEQCQFAHGRQELRDALRNSKYKTKSCQKYWVTGYCAYGPRCNFLHCESDETSNPQSITVVGNNQFPTEMENVKFNSSFEGEVSPATSDEELAETVQGVITMGREILNQMEKDQTRCDPKLEDLFAKLKRALPPKRSSTPVGEAPKLNISHSFESSIRTSPLELDNDKFGDHFYPSHWIHQNDIARENIKLEAREKLMNKYAQQMFESQDFSKCASKRDIFSLNSTRPTDHLSPRKPIMNI